MTRRLLFRALGFGAALAIGATGCSSGSGGKAASTTTTVPAHKLTAVAGFVNVASVSGSHDLAPADRRALLAAVADYVRAATLRPLKGQKSPGLATLFVPTAAPALSGPERATVVDADVPRATGPVDAKLAPVSLHGLADLTGAIDLVGATIDLTVSTRTAQGPVTIHRTGQLMFERDSGKWKILGFQLAVTRDGAGLGPATPPSSTKAGA